MELVYEGKSKRVWRVGGLYHLEFKDEVTAGDGAVKAAAPGKGALAAELSAVLFAHLAARGVATHFVEYKPPNVLVAVPAEVAPVEVVVRFKAYGSQLKRMPRLKPLQPLSKPLVEFHLKDDALHDPLIYPQDAVEAGLLTWEELAYVEAASLRAAEALRELYDAAGCDLLDVKFEFGRTPRGLVLVDEISGDTFRVLCRGEHLDKEYFRKTRDVEGLLRRYRELLEITKASLGRAGGGAVRQ
ncbi:phosphoribosylaminoimidazolesuccinocarboxamide synthase [Pyrobaculum ferrireducens]|uniref:phosphoribosylaminoimidazolesuccinocarboxamide synthase n=1 Tax=Pyrobaculum ferrireducens TaxID=1104324 RepID=UPI0011E52C75|nr:phosphoribosylaminoimidazolesuccinocarboxamide synthase [Pyrobaculum ferrireducens]